jgi:hypothetical protein
MEMRTLWKSVAQEGKNHPGSVPKPEMHFGVLE